MEQRSRHRCYGLWSWRPCPLRFVGDIHGLRRALSTAPPLLQSSISGSIVGHVNGAVTYFAFTLIWPQAVARLYTDLSSSEAIVLSGLATLCFVLGQMSGPFIANWLPSKPLMVGCAIAGSTLLAAVATNSLDRIRIHDLPFKNTRRDCHCWWIEWSYQNIRQRNWDCGVYGTILTNCLAITIPLEVGPASIRAGLPPSSAQALVADFLASTTPTAATIPGWSPSILTAAQIAYKTASAQAYRTVFLSTLSFSGVAIIMVFFTMGVDQS